MKAKSYLAIFALSLSGLATEAAADMPEIAGQIANSCVTQAQKAAGGWRNACLDLAKFDGVITEVERQRCAEHGQAMYTIVMQQCMSSLLTVYQPTFKP